MRASSRRLALKLAERIRGVLPTPLAIAATGSGIYLYADGEVMDVSLAANIIEVEDGRALGERMETAARGVLGGIQDSVMRHLHEKWPTERDGELALPDARTDIERMYFWYGSREEAAVIAFEPIAFAEIES